MALPDRQPTVRTLTPRGDTIRVAQITDTHLKAFAGGKLLGLDTDYSLQAIVDLVRREFPQPDLLLGTGDLERVFARNPSRS
jgi:Icc protein